MMGWIDRALFAACTLALILTALYALRTMKELTSAPPSVPLPPEPVSETDPDTGEEYRLWTDDVLAEDELKTRMTQGAAAHSSDVCPFWDEQDARDADIELHARLRRSIRRL